MSVQLTTGVLEKMTKGEVSSERDMIPVVQLTELKPVVSKLQQQQRYRMLLSDGISLQQGMLGTTKNDLVETGRLKIGSIIQMNQFVCNVIQGRRIVIVIELDVLVQDSDIIGNPLPPPRPSEHAQNSSDHRGNSMANPQSYGGNSLTSGSINRPNAGLSPQQQSYGGSSLPTGSINRPNVGISPQQQNRVSQFPGGSFSNSDSGKYGPTNGQSVYPKPDIGAGPTTVSGSASLNASHSDQNMGFRNPRPPVSQPRPTTYQHPVQPVYQPPSMYSNRGPVAKNDGPARIIPIAALNPYQGRWTIKARVSTKGELRHYNNPRGDGKVFSFDLLDAEGGEIRITCFNAVAEQFYNQIEVGKVYFISRGSLKPAEKKFNHLKNDFEIVLDNSSTVQQCFEDDKLIPQHQFHFRPISDIEGMESNGIVDIIGVVSSISPTFSIMRKNGTETQKRSLQLKDMSGRSVELTLWGNFCNAEGQKLQNLCDAGSFPVLAVKASRVNDFNGKAVGTISTSQLHIDLDHPETYRLKEWFEKEGRNTPSISLSREASSMGRTESRKTISQIKDDKLGTSEKPDWITVCATVSFIKSDSFCYTACPVMIGDRPCSKKVTCQGDGTWRCDRCDKCVDECEYRYVLQLQIQDHTGLTWVTAFQEAGEEIMGLSAKELHYVKDKMKDDDRFADIIRKVLFMKYIFKLKVKEETFSDEQRIKVNVVRCEKVNHSSESNFLLELMGKLRADDSTTLCPKAETPNLKTELSYNTAERVGIQQSGSGGEVGYQYGGSGHSTANFPSGRSHPGQYGGNGDINRVSDSGGNGSSAVSSGRYGSFPRQPVGGF